jgi:hypothetical protein
MTASWHPLGKNFISCGMDSTVKMWSLEGDEMKRALADSFLRKHHSESKDKMIGVVCENFPVTFDKVHTNYGKIVISTK